jgi:PadR family transcriptional regulator, regulatory protein AphA
MARANKTKYAILGLLSLKPASGYDIKKIVDESIGFFWNENFGHIYPILARMEKEGLVRKLAKESGDRKARNVYALTARGEREFLEWLGEPADVTPHRNELLLKLFFGRRIDRGAVEAILAEQRRKNQELLEIYGGVARHIDEVGTPEAPYWRFTLDYGIRIARMHVEWCDETLKALKRLSSSKKEKRS